MLELVTGVQAEIWCYVMQSNSIYMFKCGTNVNEDSYTYLGAWYGKMIVYMSFLECYLCKWHDEICDISIWISCMMHL